MNKSMKNFTWITQNKKSVSSYFLGCNIKIISMLNTVFTLYSSIHRLFDHILQIIQAKSTDIFRDKRQCKFFFPTVFTLCRDYSRKLFWTAIPYAWERAANAARVHGKRWAPLLGSRWTTLSGFTGKALETITF